MTDRFHQRGVVRQVGLSSATPAASHEYVETFRALSDPTRLEMIRMAAETDEVACTTFLERFGVSKSTISYHVKVLRSAGLIKVRKEGQFYRYRLDRSGDPLMAVLLPMLTNTRVDRHSDSDVAPTDRGGVKAS
jgi:ArsR family transcriptional regulator